MNCKYPLFLSVSICCCLGVVIGTNAGAQNFSRTATVPGQGVYINTGPQNPLLNNLQASWETANLQAQEQLTRAQAAQVMIQNQIMIEQAAKQERQEQMIQQQQREIEQLRRQQQSGQ